MKKRGIGWGVLLFALCLGGFGMMRLGQDESVGIFYRVSDGAHELYLLGSIHVGSDAMYPMGKPIRQAIQNANVLIFECDTQSEEALAETRRMMAYPQGETLFDHISEECRERVTNAAQTAGYPLETLEGLKPWAVTSMFSTQSTAAGMGNRRPGVEEMVRRLGRQKAKVYLETTAEQLGALDGFSPELQEYLLDSACREVLNPGLASEHVRSWPQWWAQGNAQAFADAYLQEQAAEPKPELAREYHATLVTQRNQRMAERLREWLESGQRCFAVIGLMHLVLPDDSVLSELEAMGYTVQKIEN